MYITCQKRCKSFVLPCDCLMRKKQIWWIRVTWSHWQHWNPQCAWAPWNMGLHFHTTCFAVVGFVWPYIWFHQFFNGPLARYVKLRVAHASGMPGTFSPPPWVSNPDMHQGTCGTHVPWCMPGSLTSGFLLSWWWGKRSRHSWCMRNPQSYVSGKRPMEENLSLLCYLMPPR